MSILKINAISAGPLAYADAAGTNCTPLDARRLTRFCCSFAVPVTGSTVTRTPGYSPGRTGRNPRQAFPFAIRRSIPWNENCASTCAPSPKKSRLFLMLFPMWDTGGAHMGASPVVVYFCFRPCRYIHGGIGFSSCHSPTRAARASRSRRRKSHSMGAYVLYHHAHPALTISALTDSIVPAATLQTTRPYLSGPTSCIWSGPPVKKLRSARRADLKPSCPCSGASMPQSRTRIFRLFLFTTSKVSPSKTPLTVQ